MAQETIMVLTDDIDGSDGSEPSSSPSMAVAGKGQVLLVVDQPSTIGPLPVAVAQAEGIMVGYLPGLAIRRIAELSMLCGLDDDLAKQATATSNRIRGLLTQVHPALERVIGKHLDHPAK